MQVSKHHWVIMSVIANMFNFLLIKFSCSGEEFWNWVRPAE